MTTKTFETKAEAKKFCLAQFCKLCRVKYLCNYKLSEAKGYWRNCLGVRQGLCSYYLKRGALSYCNNPQMSTEFCLGKQCKDLPKVVVEEEQKVPAFYFGANAPKGPDHKQRAAGDDSSL